MAFDGYLRVWALSHLAHIGKTQKTKKINNNKNKKNKVTLQLNTCPQHCFVPLLPSQHSLGNNIVITVATFQIRKRKTKCEFEFESEVSFECELTELHK